MTSQRKQQGVKSTILQIPETWPGMGGTAGPLGARGGKECTPHVLGPDFRQRAGIRQRPKLGRAHTRDSRPHNPTKTTRPGPVDCASGGPWSPPGNPGGAAPKYGSLAQNMQSARACISEFANCMPAWPYKRAEMRFSHLKSFRHMWEYMLEAQGTSDMPASAKASAGKHL